MRKTLMLIILSMFFVKLDAQTFRLVTSNDEIDGDSKYIFVSFSPNYSNDNNVYLVGEHNVTWRKIYKTNILGDVNPDGTTHGIPSVISLSDIDISYIKFSKQSSGSWYIVDSNVQDTGSEKCYICREGDSSTSILLGDGNDANLVWKIDISSDGLAFVGKSNSGRRLDVNFTNDRLGYYSIYDDNLYIFKYEGEYTPGPILTASRSSIQFYVPKGGSQTENIGVSGKYLTGDVSVKVSGSGFSVNKKSILKDEAGNASVAVTYTGETNSTGTLTFESEGCSPVVVALSAEIIEESADFKFSSSEGHSYLAGVSSTYGTYPALFYRGEAVGNGAVKYTSSDESVATVDAVTGQVTSHSVGNCKITAELLENGLKAYYQLYVTDKMYVRLYDIDDITSGEYVLIGQKAEDSFGVFDFDEYDENNSSFRYNKEYSSVQNSLFGDCPLINMKVTSGSGNKYCKISKSTDKGYLAFVDGKESTNVELSTSGNAISLSLGILDGCYSLKYNNRYLAPYAGSKNQWKMYVLKSGSVVQAYNDGNCLYLYRQALNVSSATDRKLFLSGEWNSEIFSSIMAAYPSATWVDMTGVTGLPGDLNFSRENCIFVVPSNASETLKSMPNVVSNGVADKIVLTDSEAPFYAYEQFEAALVSYDRTFSGNTSTVCLPFSCEIPADADVYEMTAFNEHVVDFCKASSIEAYKPYIIKADGDVFADMTSAEDEHYIFPATSDYDEMSESIGTLTFCGTMSKQKLQSDNFTKYYGYSGGELKYVGIDKVGYVNPFRAYFVERSTDDLKTANVVLYDVPSSIEPVEDDGAEFVDVYSVDGRLIKASVKRSKASEGLDKGVYIIGKRKVLVK